MARSIFLSGDQMSKQPATLITKTMAPLAEKLDTDIVICLCHGKYELLPSEIDFDKLYIYVQLLPEVFSNIQKISRTGYKLNGKDVVFPIKEDGLQPCPQGDSLTFTDCPDSAKLILDDNKVAMAAVYDGAIYFMNDFIHARSMDEWKISCEVFNYVIDQALKTDELSKYLRSGIKEKSKRSLEVALRVQFVQRLEKETIQLKAAKDTVIQYEKGIVEGERKIWSIEKIVTAIRNNIADIPTALDKTWNSLQKMENGEHYTSISFSKIGIKAITTPIFIEFNLQEYEMGRYTVNMLFDGTCTITSLDFKVDSTYDHPHITGGRVCWGNFSGYIPKLIGSSEFDVALMQIYTFLCHYDEGNPYKKIDRWPLKKQVEEIKYSSEEEEKLKVRV